MRWDPRGKGSGRPVPGEGPRSIPSPREELAERVASISWYHRMTLPGGVVTPGVIDPSRNLPRLRLPASLAGRSVLDVGAWDGFYSFECARRGASRVLATDSYSWGGGGWGTKDGFLLAREALGLTALVDDQTVDVMELAPERVGGTFDVVLLLGVLYHLRDPITALERVATCCSGLLVIETETAMNWLPRPAARMYPGSELAGDHTNWYQHNVPALRGLLCELGFRDVSVEYLTPWRRRVARAALDLGRRRPLSELFQSRRLVLHARAPG